MAKKSKVVTFNECDIVFKELTVKEVRELLEIKTSNYFDALAMDDISLTELAHMAGVGVDLFDCATGTDLDELRAAAKEVNPLFFGVRERLAKLVEKVQ
jgi:hypothetical protein